MKIDWSKFKKTSQDKTHATLKHEDGHELRIAIKALSPQMRKQLGKLSVDESEAKDTVKMADGGEVGQYAKKPKSDDTPGIDQKKASQFEKGATESGWQPQQWAANAKQAVGMADGGEITKDDFGNPVDEVDAGPLYAPGGPLNKPATDNSTSENLSLPSAPLNDSGMGMAPESNPQETEALGAPPQPGEMPHTQAGASGTWQDNVAPTQPESAPASMPQAPMPQQSPVSAYEMQTKAIQDQAKAQQDLAKAQQANYTAQATKAKEVIDNFTSQTKTLTDERNALLSDIENKHIDPNHYLGSMGTYDRMLTSVGLILGGLGGGGQSNQALEFLNKQIDRDIDAQKAELGKKETLLSANLKEFGNLRDATEMTRLNMSDLAAAKINASAAAANGPMAKARADQFLGALKQQQDTAQQQLALRKSLSGEGQAPGQLIKQDPASFVSQVVPKEHQKQVFGEIEAAQNTRHMAKNIIQSFDDAAEENTILKTGGGLLRTPASVYALHQHMQPTFKDLEGTVRQAAMENTFKNVTPMPGDSEHTIAQKKQALEQYLQSKMSAPTAKGFGIDLSKFESTNTKPEGRLSDHDRMMLELARKNPTHKNAVKIFKQLGIDPNEQE